MSWLPGITVARVPVIYFVQYFCWAVLLVPRKRFSCRIQLKQYQVLAEECCSFMSGGGLMNI